MRFNLARAVRAGLLILGLSLLGCGQSTTLSPEPTSLTLDEALAQVQAVDLSSLDAETQLQLRENFSNMLIASGKTRFVSAVVGVGVSDLAVTDNGDTTATFRWTYVNRGDYDQNSEANVADLTPLGKHLNKDSTSPDWQTAQVADGDRNTAVTVADLTPLGATLLDRVDLYHLEVSTDSGANWSNVTDVPFSAALLPDGGGFKYFEVEVNDPEQPAWYRVVSMGAGTDGVPSNIVELPNQNPPIQNLTATQGTVDGSVDLSWDEHPNASSGYEIRRGDSAAGPFTTLENFYGSTTYSDLTAAPTVHYWYVVWSLDADGPNASSPPVEGWAMDTISPPAPQNVAATDGGATDEITITWDPVAGAALYHVWRSATPGSGHVEIGQTVDPTYHDLVNPGEEFYYYVTTEDAQGGISAPSNEDAGSSDALPGTVTLTLVSPPAVGSGSAIDPYIVSASTNWQFLLQDSNDGDVTTHLATTYTLSDIAELSINGDDLFIDDNPALTFNFYGSYNGQDSNAIHFQLQAGGGPPTLTLDNPPPLGSGTLADPYITPPDADFDFTLTDPILGVVPPDDVTVSDQNIQVTDSNLYVGPTPPPAFNFYGTYNSQQSNTIYFSVESGASTLVIFPHPIDFPTWSQIPNYDEPDAGSEAEPFVMHNMFFNPDDDADGVCDMNFMLAAEDNGNPVDNEDLDWGSFPPFLTLDIDNVGSKGQFHVTEMSGTMGYVFAQDASLNTSNSIWLEIF